MLKLYNTLTKKKEVFKELHKGKVGMYTCGPTVYDFAHIGNFRAYIAADVLRRYLEYCGYEVKHVMNITDVDDKTIRNSQKEGIPLEDYTDRYTKAFFEYLKTLNIEPAHVFPRATEHINEMVAMIKLLLDKGIAYKGSDGSTYYNIRKFKDYGKLSGIKVDELKSGARVKQDEYEKDQAHDFALWKAWDKDDGDVYWETEIGKGRPGWHIECSAMSTKYLGCHFDIHTGGIDLVFPHHENEIAQSEAFTGKSPFVRYWMHVGLLNVKGEKMAKSLKNYFSVKAALRRYDPDVLRIFLTSAHYRKPLEFSENALKSTENRVLFWKEAAAKAARYSLEGRKGELNESEMEVRREMHLETKKFFSALSDDFNTPVAYASLDALASMASRIVSEGLSPNLASEVVYLMDRTSSLLGIDVLPRYQRRDSLPYIETLIEVRKELRKRRMYDISDAIRAKLKDLGVAVEDKNGDSIWWFEE